MQIMYLSCIIVLGNLILFYIYKGSKMLDNKNNKGGSEETDQPFMTDSDVNNIHNINSRSIVPVNSDMVYSQTKEEAKNFDSAIVYDKDQKKVGKIFNNHEHGIFSKVPIIAISTTVGITIGAILVKVFTKKPSLDKPKELKP